MKTKFSVVIPTFNRPQLLEKCLTALSQQQTNVWYEVIVVSDGKDAATESLVKKYADQNVPFVYTALDKKSGPAAARNKGWKTAQGELIVFTDDDTQPSLQWLQNYWKAYVLNYGNLMAFTGEVKVPVSSRPTDYERNTAGLETADFVTANCAVTKKALTQVNGFDEDFAMAWREDSELHFKLLNAQIPISKIDDALVVHPVRKAKWGVSLREQKKSMYNALLYKKHPELFKQKIHARPLWNYYAMTAAFISAIALAAAGLFIPALVAVCTWLLLVGRFTGKRLKDSSLAPSHVSEMIITSSLIPFLSVFWTLYGSVKYKVFFL